MMHLGKIYRARTQHTRNMYFFLSRVYDFATYDDATLLLLKDDNDDEAGFSSVKAQKERNKEIPISIDIVFHIMILFLLLEKY